MNNQDSLGEIDAALDDAVAVLDPADLGHDGAESAGHAEPGQGLVEYALILVLIALVVFGTVLSFGQNAVRDMYTYINDTLPF